jgi:exosome complex RNA-binding protein Rrp42 (RNase PH superfamily)
VTCLRLNDSLGWELFFDIIVLDDKVGNLLSFISHAIAECLATTATPDVGVFVNKNTGATELELKPTTSLLKLTDIPRILSFGKIAETLVADLTFDEEQCVQGTCHVARTETQVKGIELVGDFTFADLQLCLSVELRNNK